MKRKVFTIVVLFVLSIGLVPILSNCLGDAPIGDSNSNINFNFNSNSNFNFNFNLSVTDAQAKYAVESQVVNICKVYADKIILLCKNESELTAWHLTAFEDKDLFIKICIADEIFGEDDIVAIEEDVNFAASCDELLESL